MPSPVYLFTGPEFGERNDAVQSVKTAMKKKFGQVDEYLYYASETGFGDVITTLQSESLFVPAACIVLRGAELIKGKDDIALLASWIASVSPSAKNPSPKDTSVLILVSDEISIDQKIEKIIPKENRRIFWEMFENRKSEWLQGFFRKNGYRISPDAVSSILDLVENNTEALRSECSRFFLCFSAEHEITEKDVDNVLAHNREESAFSLFDAMARMNEKPEKRLENALDILQKISLSKNSSSVMILAGLTSCFRRLAVWHAVHAEGGCDDFTLKTKGFASQKARNQYAAAARIWSSGQTAAITALLSSTDMAIRSGGASSEDTLLQMMLYAIIIKNGSFCAVYE